MEKQAKKKTKIFSFLPKAASFTFRNNPPFSPGREKTKANHVAHKGFSGPIISIVPVEARWKSKSGRSFESQEPTSPKVSCIGQIKQHKKKKKKILKSKRSSLPPRAEKKKPPPPQPLPPSSSFIRSIFHGKKPGKKFDASTDKTPLPDELPSLGQMKRFTSGRDVLADFDWTTYDGSAPMDRRNCYSDNEEEESSGEDDEIIIPFSAPMMVGGGGGGGGGGVALETRKEVNLWKRRTLSPPMPLQLSKMGKP